MSSLILHHQLINNKIAVAEARREEGRDFMIHVFLIRNFYLQSVTEPFMKRREDRECGV